MQDLATIILLQCIAIIALQYIYFVKKNIAIIYFPLSIYYNMWQNENLLLKIVICKIEPIKNVKMTHKIFCQQFICIDNPF